MATTTAANGGQVTVTVTSVPEATEAAASTSSTLSLIYVYSTSASSLPTSSSSSSSASSHRVSGGVIAGIVVGSVAFLVLLFGVLFCYSRKVARRRRAENSSRNGASSRAHSHATTATGQRHSQYARSMGERSTATGTGTVTMSLKSPSPMLPKYPPPAELPTSHNSPRARLVHVVRNKSSRPDVAEMYGSYTHPVELQGGSTSDLVSEMSEMKRMKAARSPSGQDSRRDLYSSDAGSSGYKTPEPGWHSSNGPVSDGTETDCGTEHGMEHGTADAASIHIYYRNSAATIAQAMSQASLRSSQRVPRSAMRSNSIPLSSQTSLADTAR